jgi:SAM-dependent MidA family methyltransferase
MTPLARRLAEAIRLGGPMSVQDYMAACLFDPAHGYYATREPFGRGGDFVTAPEISQMFGELIAIWLRGAYEAIGRPEPFTLAEIGPGRGTLIKDMLRTLGRLDGAMRAAMRVALVETSPRLTEIQRRSLAADGVEAAWHLSTASLPGGPLLIVGNEIFDAVPIRQYVRTRLGWRERVVGLDESGALCFLAGPGGVDPALLPKGARDAPEGAVAELAPARSAMMDGIARRIASEGGAGLFVDYGYGERAIGDTLQAVRAHAYDDVLAHPGEADLTAHVDFAALRLAAAAHGLATGLMEQGEFLLALGLLERAGALGAALDEAGREGLRRDTDRLAGPEQMGRLFKVLAVLPKGVAAPPFPASD